MNDLEDDVHKASLNTDTEEITVAPNDAAIRALVAALKPHLIQLIDECVVDYMNNIFDINDYKSSFDFSDLESSIVDDVIEEIKYRL